MWLSLFSNTRADETACHLSMIIDGFIQEAFPFTAHGFH